MRIIPPTYLLLSSYLLASQAFAGIFPEPDYLIPGRVKADPPMIYNSHNFGQAVPGILQFQRYGHYLETPHTAAIPEFSSGSLNWEDLIGLQPRPHQIPEALKKLIQQKLQPDIDFSQTILPIPKADPGSQLMVDEDGIHFSAPDKESAEVNTPPFRIAITIETDRLMADFDSQWLVTAIEEDEYVDPALNLLLKSMFITILDPLNQEAYAITKNGQLVYVNIEELRRMYQQFLNWLKMMAYRNLMAFIEYWFIELPSRGPTITTSNGGENNEGRRVLRKRPRATGHESTGHSQAKRVLRSDTLVNKEPGHAHPEKTPSSSSNKKAKKTKKHTLTPAEIQREKEKILAKAKEAGLTEIQVTSYDTIIFEKINKVVSNALVYFGEDISALSQNGEVAPPESGEQLAHKLRELYQLESQYLARMMRHFAYTPPSHHRVEEHTELIKNYQNALVYLLQYIALDSGRWLLSEELIQQWLEYEDGRWEASVNDLFFSPATSLIENWGSTTALLTKDCTRAFRPVTSEKPLGPAVEAELERYKLHTESFLDKSNSYSPKHGDRSFFYLMTLLLLDDTLLETVRSWIKALDPRPPEFFTYYHQNWDNLKTSRSGEPVPNDDSDEETSD